MDKDPSFLFAGIKFDRKRFAKDFERFKEKKEHLHLEEIPTFIEPEKHVPDEGKRSVKKRKRKAVAAGNVQILLIL
ncbi:hypothetical protein Dimus_007194 [Dionaea muscipula]